MEMMRLTLSGIEDFEFHARLGVVREEIFTLHTRMQDQGKACWNRDRESCDFPVDRGELYSLLGVLREVILLVPDINVVGITEQERRRWVAVIRIYIRSVDEGHL